MLRAGSCPGLRLLPGGSRGAQTPIEGGSRVPFGQAAPVPKGGFASQHPLVGKERGSGLPGEQDAHPCPPNPPPHLAPAAAPPLLNSAVTHDRG